MPSAALCSVLALLLPAFASSAPFSIDSFGAVAGVDTHAAALANGAALLSALRAANASAPGGSRSALVPAGRVYAYLPAAADVAGLRDVTLLLEGTLALYTAGFASADPSVGYPGWPSPWPALSFSACTNLTVASEGGAGLIDGRGNAWWWYTIFRECVCVCVRVCARGASVCLRRCSHPRARPPPAAPPQWATTATTCSPPTPART
jgi:hypothetical protein